MALLKRAQEENRIKGVSFRSTGPKVTHLLFADDSIVFLEGSSDNMLELKEILRQYEEASGQRINLQKSSIFLAGAFMMALRDNCKIFSVFTMRHSVSDTWVSPHWLGDQWMVRSDMSQSAQRVGQWIEGPVAIKGRKGGRCIGFFGRRCVTPSGMEALGSGIRKLSIKLYWLNRHGGFYSAQRHCVLVFSRRGTSRILRSCQPLVPQGELSLFEVHSMGVIY